MHIILRVPSLRIFSFYLHCADDKSGSSFHPSFIFVFLQLLILSNGFWFSSLFSYVLKFHPLVVDDWNVSSFLLSFISVLVFLFLIPLFEGLFVSLSLQFTWDDKYVGGQFSIHPASRSSKSVLEGTEEALACYFLNNRGNDSTFIRRLTSMCTKINEVGKAFGYHLLYLSLLCLL